MFIFITIKMKYFYKSTYNFKIYFLITQILQLETVSIQIDVDIYI